MCVSTQVLFSPLHSDWRFWFDWVNPTQKCLDWRGYGILLLDHLMICPVLVRL